MRTDTPHVFLAFSWCVTVLYLNYIAVSQKARNSPQTHQFDSTTAHRNNPTDLIAALRCPPTHCFSSGNTDPSRQHQMDGTLQKRASNNHKSYPLLELVSFKSQKWSNHRPFFQPSTRPPKTRGKHHSKDIKNKIEKNRKK